MAVEKSRDAYRTIGEVAEELELPQHVLRFWESKFGYLRPMKRAGGRRLYRPADVALLAGIRRLLYEDGYTIRGVQRILRERGPRHVAELGGLAPREPSAADRTSTSAAPRPPDTEAESDRESAAPPPPPDAIRSGPSGFVRAGVARPSSPGAPPGRPPFAQPGRTEGAGGSAPAAGHAERPTGGPSRLDPEARRTLEAALAELLACKRILDGVD